MGVSFRVSEKYNPCTVGEEMGCNTRQGGGKLSGLRCGGVNSDIRSLYEYGSLVAHREGRQRNLLQLFRLTNPPV
jgi:hypothetical protein